MNESADTSRQAERTYGEAWADDYDVLFDEVDERMIDRLVDLSQPTVSKHLRILEEAGLLLSTRHKNFIRYEVKKDVLVSRLFDFMTNFCSVSQELKREAIEKLKAEPADGPIQVELNRLTAQLFALQLSDRLALRVRLGHRLAVHLVR